MKNYYTCQECKVVTHAPQGQLQPLPVPEYCWQHIKMDLITCLPKTNHSIDAIDTFIDRLSKYTYFIHITTLISADNSAQVFLSTVVTRHRVPERLILDCDPHYISASQKGPILAFGA